MPHYKAQKEREEDNNKGCGNPLWCHPRFPVAAIKDFEEFLVRLSQHGDCQWPSQQVLYQELVLRTSAAKGEISDDSSTQEHGIILGSKKSPQFIEEHIRAIFKNGIWVSQGDQLDAL